MFSVRDYAEEMGITVQEVLKKCAFLEIKANGAEDMLSEDDVIMLDNAIDIMESVEEADEYEVDEEEEQLVEETEKKDIKKKYKNIPIILKK